MSAAIELQAPPRPPLLILSPHLDDAVFACGRLLAAVPGATVATVFAGRPPPAQPLTEWDRAAGFSAGDDVIAARREEDRRALAQLAARPLWLEWRDAQYGPTPCREPLSRGLETLLAEQPAAAVVLPLGLFHSDHRLVADATLSLCAQLPARRWYVYAEALYRRIAGLVGQRLRELREAGFALHPVRFAEPAGAADAKRAAIACYRSQLRALATPGRPGHADADAGEDYWQLAAAP